MVKEIGHYSLENPATIFDEEAMTALELAARTAGKVNECVKEVNDIPAKIAADVQAHIDNGDFDRAINEYSGDLEHRLDTLIGNVAQGSTTMDAEIIDARMDVEGNIHANLGTAIRALFEKTLTRKTPADFDADTLLESGFYVVGSSDNWAGLPEGESGGCLVAFDGSAPSRRYQFFLSYNDALYMRHMLNNVWQEWATLPNTSITPTLLNGSTGIIDKSLDDLREMGIYRVSSAGTHDAPDAAGLLIVYSTGIATQCYQMFLGFHEGMFYRSLVGTVWTEWKRVANVGGTTDAGSTGTIGGSALPYLIQRVDNTTIKIYHRGTKGYVCYRVGYEDNPDISLNTVRLQQITVHDINLTQVGVVTDYGHDIEGVVLMDGGTHVGGVHGYEIMSAHRLFVGGAEYTIKSAPEGETDTIELWVDSVLDEQIARTKRIVFKPDGKVEFLNYMKPLLSVIVDKFRTCMFSIYKDRFTDYCLPAVLNKGGPVLVPHNGYAPDGEEPTTIENRNPLGTLGAPVSDIRFIGDVSATLKWDTEYAYGPTSLEVIDYGDRIKVYVNSAGADMITGEYHLTTHEIDVRY